jgi:hypothetical protein
MHAPFRYLTPSLLLVVLMVATTGCGVRYYPVPPPTDGTSFNADQLITDIRTLAAAEMEGRRPGTPGHGRAQEYIRQRFTQVGLAPFGDVYDRPISFVLRGETERLEGANLVGIIPGTTGSDRYVVVTAHYDHLGLREGQIYHGADDNASGTAALFAIADYFRRNPPRHPVVIAALDAEEGGLHGARAFVANPPVPRDRIVLNVNMDMISRNERGELYAAGTFHYPFLAPYVVRTAERARLSLLMGHDDPALGPREDWTMLSDHGAFHEAGIPFIYFGVEDHPDYHQPTDTFENIDPTFYVRAVETVIDFLREVDRNLPAIDEARRP